jgi:hypothetical protein
MSGALAAISSAASSAGAAAGAAMATPGFGYAVSAASSMSQMMGARSQARGLAAQATMARLQAKTESLKYKQQGLSILDNILQTQAAINARAGAGGIDPNSGSARALAQYALSRGAQETYTIMDNQVIAERGGEMQAQQYMQQARSTMRAGFIGSIASGATTAYQFGLIGKPLEPVMGYGAGQVDPRLFRAAGLG